MDFHRLSRKELQALCKKNKIPANITNVAMANALAALERVEGLEEFLNPVDPVPDAQKLPDEKGAETPDIHRAACRTSTRRKPVIEEPENSKVSTRLKLRTREGNDQENKDLNVPLTPAAVPSSRRRAPPVTKTPAASSSRVRATSAYNTRRSIRLLEKNLSKIDLTDTEGTGSEKVNEISEETISVSQQIEDSADTEKGASSQTVSAETLEKTNESEVTSSEKNTGYECQSNGSKSLVQLHTEVANDAGASLQDEPQECLGKIYKDDMNSRYKGVPQDSNSKPSMSSEKCYEAVEASECCDESDFDLTKSIGKQVDANKEAGSGILLEIENSCTPSEPEKISPCSKHDAFSSDSEDDVSVEVSEDKQKKDEYSTVGNDIEKSELIIFPENKAVGMDDSAETYVPQGAKMDDSTVANDIQNSELMFCAENKAVGLEDNTYSLPVVCEELEAKVEEYVEKDACSENSMADIQVSIEASSEGNMNVQSVTVSLDSSLVRDEAEAADFPEGKDAGSENSMANIQVSIEASSEGNMNVKSVTGSLDSSLVGDEAEAADFHEGKYAGSENSMADIQVSIEASSEGNMNVKSVTGSLDSSLVGDEAKVEEYVEKDASSENSMADIQVSIEASSEGNMNVQSVTGSLDSSLVRDEAEAADFHEGKDAGSENSMADIQVSIEASSEGNMNVQSVTGSLDSSLVRDEAEAADFHERKDAGSKNSIADIQVGIETSSEGNMNVKSVTGPFESSLVRDEAKVEEYVEKDASSENSMADIQVSIEASSEENMNVRSVTGSLDSSLVRDETEAADFHVEKYASSKNSIADIQVSIEASSEGNMKVKSVTGSVDSSLVRDEAEAEAEAADFQIESKKEHPAAEATWDAADTVTSVPICHDVPTQLIVDDQFTCQALAVVKDNAIINKCKQEKDEQKENQNNDDLQKTSMRKLKKMLKNLSLDGKTNKSSDSVNKEVERKRTALQALPENQMTASNDD